MPQPSAVSQLQATVNRYRQERLARREIPDEALLSDAGQASVDRVAISRVLKQHGYHRTSKKRTLVGRAAVTGGPPLIEWQMAGN